MKKLLLIVLLAVYTTAPYAAQQRIERSASQSCSPTQVVTDISRDPLWLPTFNDILETTLDFVNNSAFEIGRRISGDTPLSRYHRAQLQLDLDLALPALKQSSACLEVTDAIEDLTRLYKHVLTWTIELTYQQQRAWADAMQARLLNNLDGLEKINFILQYYKKRN